MPETAFLGAQIAPKSLSAGASPQTPLGELTALPQTPLQIKPSHVGFRAHVKIAYRMYIICMMHGSERDIQKW